MAIKKNKNNPDNKAGTVKQNKLRSSEYCEKSCSEVGVCEKYKEYIRKMTIFHKVGKGLNCSK